ncbi:polymeric immunoglobulin receptor [Apodemus sylvaticus]|uniref:polymeric immunoglobulin receptor n=1 Tax=Apodemus sylvaticus TaxID=10129 RepID=UPI002241FC8C|nr:polymeric immunoglobulin receptor [Apodemus sylvaticus]
MAPPPWKPQAMRLSLFTLLVTVFSGVSTKSPIFGPQDVSSIEGNSVSITCYYPDTSVNRHTRKYWCRQGASGSCTTLISSNGYLSKEYADRARLVNFPENSTFVINIEQLTQDDTGSYKCGLGANNRGLSFDISLEVSQVPEFPNDTHVYTTDIGRNVTIKCNFKRENAPNKKSLCKKTGQTCELVIDSTENVNPSYKGRADLFTKGTSLTEFYVNISHLMHSDAGLYVCQAGEGSSADKENVDLQVLEPEPELLYKDLRSSVTFECDLGREVAKEAKYLCRKNKETCDVIINTLEKRDPAFEGRVLLTPRDDNGRFSVLITGLRKEDAGHYQCGATSSGLPQEGWPIQAWQLFVNEESTIPNSRSIVKGVTGGSVAIVCPYNPKESSSLKYWCRWEGEGNGRCPVLVGTQAIVQEEYEGRLALFDEPGSGTYTVILNQLTTQDAGFYWCLTDGDSRWRTTIELQVSEATKKPDLEVTPQNATAVLGETLTISCHYPCKFYSQEKYWCKWSNNGCHILPSLDEAARQSSVSCDQSSQIVSMTLNPVSKEDEGWYWCGVKEGQAYGETTAIYVAVEERTRGSPHVNPTDANARAKVAPEEGVVESSVSENENKGVQNPRHFADQIEIPNVGDQVQENRASGDAGSANGQSTSGQSGSSKVLFSTLVPLGLVLAVGAVAVWVARVRHRKNVDRMSISSYRTDISMSDFKNSRDFGGNDNMGVSPDTQETVVEGKDEIVTTTECTAEPEESKKAKRSSKEEADMAYSAFLFQSSTIAAQVHNGPQEV